MKLVSLNIERSKHLDRIGAFLDREQPEIFCAQELCERDIPRIAAHMGPCRVFAPVTLHPADVPETEPLVVGNGIFTSVPILAADAWYYLGSEVKARHAPVKPRPNDLSLASVKLLLADRAIEIMTTHFTWSPEGTVTDEQHRDLASLRALLEQHESFYLCGDFNAPRGRAIFDALAAQYTDLIPPHYATSIDASRHRAGALPYMVDGLFATAGLGATAVRLQDGLSDHMAIVADIERVIT